MDFCIVQINNCVGSNHDFSKSDQDVFSHRKKLAPVIANRLCFHHGKVSHCYSSRYMGLAAAFAAFRIGTSDAFMLGMIEGLMVTHRGLCSP